jgi:hypothetical protein
MADRALVRLGELVAEDRIGLEDFRISTDVVGQLRRLYYNVRKIADIVARPHEADS